MNRKPLDAVGIPNSGLGKITIDTPVTITKTKPKVKETITNVVVVTELPPPLSIFDEEPKPVLQENPIAVIKYTNWKNQTSKRKIVPIRIFWGFTEYHPDQQWMLEAFDVSKQEIRTFSMKNIHKWD